MAIRDMTQLWKGGVVLYIIGLIVYLVGFGTTYWYTITGAGTVTVNVGLFKGCVSDSRSGASACSDLQNLEDWQRAGQALTSVGVALLVIGGATSIFAAIRGGLALGRIGALVIIAAGMVGGIGGIVVVAKSSDEFSDSPGVDYSVGWSAILFLIACGIAISGGAMQFVGFRSLGSGESSPLLRT